jgi:uncharacterized protein (TIGR03382 family)
MVRPMLAFIGVLAVSHAAAAHTPSLSSGQYGSLETAFPVEDVDISMVLYHTVTCEAPQLWMTFDAVPGHPLVAQLGVPVLDRLSDMRPSLALIGPGLPVPGAEPLPFEIPAGLGVEVWNSEGLEPTYFLEEFTDTESWIHVDLQDHELTTGGRYWLVAWIPAGTTGKLWLTVGTLEDFTSITDAARLFELLDAVDAFHEVEGEADVQEEICPPPDAGDTGGDAADGPDAEELSDTHDGHDHAHDGDAGGCAATGSSPAPTALLGLLALVLLSTRRVRTRGMARRSVPTRFGGGSGPPGRRLP